MVEEKEYQVSYILKLRQYGRVKARSKKEAIKKAANFDFVMVADGGGGAPHQDCDNEVFWKQAQSGWKAEQITPTTKEGK